MFLDLQLPDASGDQVYKTAKQIDPGLNVIVITGYPDSEMLNRILQISPVTVLKKPLKIEQSIFRFSTEGDWWGFPFFSSNRQPLFRRQRDAVSLLATWDPSLHRAEGAGFLRRVLCTPGNVFQGGWARHRGPEAGTRW